MESLISRDIEQEAQRIFEMLGLSTEAAINIFLHQVVIHHGLPFRVSLTPDELTQNAIRGEKLYGPFETVKDLMKDLNE